MIRIHAVGTVARHPSPATARRGIKACRGLWAWVASLTLSMPNSSLQMKRWRPQLFLNRTPPGEPTTNPYSSTEDLLVNRQLTHVDTCQK
jgi:hypothetical protein